MREDTVVGREGDGKGTDGTREKALLVFWFPFPLPPFLLLSSLLLRTTVLQIVNASMLTLHTSIIPACP
jgi:hypothetical protein